MNKILVIDETSDNVSYKKSDVSSGYCFQPELSELYRIFTEEKDIDIFTIDTSKCISLIDNEGNIFSISEYKNKSKYSFLKISTSELSKADSDILIYIGADNNPNEIINNYTWQYTTSYIDLNYKPIHALCFANALTDYNGYNNCAETVLHTISNGYHSCFPAIEYCMKLYSENIKGIKYVGYLPSMGQLMVIYQYISLINYILEGIGAKSIIMGKNMWTSTENSIDSAWCVNLSVGAILAKYKGEDANVLPVFRQIQNQNINKSK